MKSPCKDCPFRKDSLSGWLGKDRALEIAESESFICHKTLKYEEGSDQSGRKQCAGYMLIARFRSIFFRLLHIQGQSEEITGKELVFDSIEGFVSHHSKKRKTNV